MKILIIPAIISVLWCCEAGFVELENDCYFQKDLQFLQALIDNSQFQSSSPPTDLSPIELGWQNWEDGRLVEFCPPYPECIKYIGKQICEN